MIASLFAPWKSARTWRALTHVMLGILLAPIMFAVTIALLATSAGLAITFPLALPFAWLLFVCVRGFGHFERSRLDWRALEAPAHRDMHAWTRHLLRVRQREVCPRLAAGEIRAVSASRFASRGLLVRWTLGDGVTLTLLANLGEAAVPAPSMRGRWRPLFACSAAPPVSVQCNPE